MAQQTARDEAGNIWEVDGQGNPIRILYDAEAQRAPKRAGQVLSLPKDPAKQAQLAATTANTEANTRRTLADIADRNDESKFGKLKPGFRWNADHSAMEPIPGSKDPLTPEQEAAAQALRMRNGQLDALVKQINEVQGLYEKGPGSTKGFAGLTDYFPTEANSAFDTAAAGLAEQGLAAFRVPGVGSQSDRELAQFVAANRPSSWDRDVSAEQKLKQLRLRVDEARKAAGLPAADWQIGATQQVRNFGPGAVPAAGAAGAPPSGPGGTPPGGTNVMDPGAFNGGPGAFNIPTNGTRLVKNPLLAGVNDRVNHMLRSGVPDAQIVQYMQGVGLDTSKTQGLNAAFQFRKQNPQYKGSYSVNLDDMAVPLSGWERTANAVATNPVGAGLISAGNAIVPYEALSSNPERTRAILEGVGNSSPGAGLGSALGTIAGGTLAAGATELGLGRLAGALPAGALARVAASPRTADAAYGAYQGGFTGDGGVMGAIEGGLTGLAGGIAGRAVARGVGNALTGVRNEAVRTLAGEGVPMTIGQTLGQSGRFGAAIKGIEDRAAGLPIVGDFINARRREGLQGFRTAAVNEAMAPIGVRMQNGVGDQAIADAQGAVGNAYDSALGGVNLQVDPQYRRALGTVVQDANRLPQPMAQTFMSTLDNRVAPMFNGQQLSGRNLQGAIQGLRKDAGAMLNRNEVQADLFKDRTVDMERALMDLAERQAPGTPAALQAANAANRRLSIVEDAAARAENQGGLFSPAQLGMAIKSNARQFNGMRGLVRGEMPLQDLQRAGQQVLPNAVPDSGTAGRMVIPLALAGAGAGGGYATGGSDGALVGASAGLLASGLYSRPAQGMLAGAVLNRPAPLSRLGEEFLRYNRYGGAIGAGTAVPALTPYLSGF